jgi:hypothetical protein
VAPAVPVPVPYVTKRSAEKTWTPRLVRRRKGAPGLAYVDEVPQDRDAFGALWVRASILPAARRGEPEFANMAPFRQRRCMADMLCQVCAARPEKPEGPYLFLMKDVGRPIQEGEVTASPPVCLPCAGKAVKHCGPLRRGFVAAQVRHAPAWGVAGVRYDPDTLQPIPAPDLERVEYDTPDLAWTVAARSCSILYGVTPVDLAAELALTA